MYNCFKIYNRLWHLIIIVLLQVMLISVACAENKVLDIDIYIKDHKFEPDIIEVQTGVKLRVTVHNLDSTIEEFDSQDLKREKIIPGGSKAKIIIAPLKAGEYHFVGEFHDETAKGKFVVTEPVSQDQIEDNIQK